MFANNINTRIKNSKMIYAKTLAILSICVLAASCSNSKITTSWVEPEHKKAYQHPMIIGVSDSQQTRRIYENYFVSALQEHNISSTPSYKLISSKQKMNRETVVAAIENTDIDAVIVTYLVAADAEVSHRTSPLNTGYSGNVENNQISETMISTRGRTSSAEVIKLKNDVYDVDSKTLVWTAQTKTTAPESIDEVVIDLTELLVNKLIDDGILK